MDDLVPDFSIDVIFEVMRMWLGARVAFLHCLVVTATATVYCAEQPFLLSKVYLKVHG